LYSPYSYWYSPLRAGLDHRLLLLLLDLGHALDSITVVLLLLDLDHGLDEQSS
jgi:hypothetical protein